MKKTGCFAKKSKKNLAFYQNLGHRNSMKIYAPNTKKRATIATIIAKDIDFKTPQEFFFQAPQNSRILIKDITTVTNTATSVTGGATVIVDDVGAKPFTAVGRKYTLTTNATQPANSSTVKIGGVTYTFKTSLTASTTINEVLRGVSVAASLTNLTAAINRTAGDANAGTLYGSLTVTNPYFSATTTAEVVTLESKIKTAAVNVIDAAAATYGIPIGASTPNLTFAAAGYGSTATTRENLVASDAESSPDDAGNAHRLTMLTTGEIVPAGYWVRFLLNVPAEGTTLNKDVVIAYVILD